MPAQQQLPLKTLRLPASPEQKLDEARRLAEAAGMFVSSRGDAYRLYRRTPGRPAFVGARTSAAELLGLVKRARAH